MHIAKQLDLFLTNELIKSVQLALRNDKKKSLGHLLTNLQKSKTLKKV